MDPCSNWGYSNYTSDGIGCDRTSAGSGYSKQYPKEWTAKYDDPTTCPEELLLFFHHLPWTHTLKSGLTIMEHIEASHRAGLDGAARLRGLWNSVSGIDAELQKVRLISDCLWLELAQLALDFGSQRCTEEICCFRGVRLWMSGSGCRWTTRSSSRSSCWRTGTLATMPRAPLAPRAQADLLARVPRARSFAICTLFCWTFSTHRVPPTLTRTGTLTPLDPLAARVDRTRTLRVRGVFSARLSC